MYCHCYICGLQYRIKPPFDNDQVTHGLCQDCFPKEMERLKKELVAIKKQAEYAVPPIPK
jgi:hypothetical protein